MRACCYGLDTVHGLLSGGRGDFSDEREFPSDKVYCGDDRGIVGVKSLSAAGLAFVVIHNALDARPVVTVPRWRMAALVMTGPREMVHGERESFIGVQVAA
jgi:hypothetical protein